MRGSMVEIDLTPLRQRLVEFSPQGRTALLPALHAAQELYGHLPEPVAQEIGAALGVPLADIFGVIEFYSLFHSHPVEKTLIHVCNDPVCAMAGSENQLKLLRQYLSIQSEKSGVAAYDDNKV